MTSPTLSPTAPKVNAKRFVAPRSEFDQGKHNYRHGLDLATCATDDMADGGCRVKPTANALAGCAAPTPAVPTPTTG
jgi:hypothetical protein